jgi:hypothetical protein
VVKPEVVDPAVVPKATRRRRRWPAVIEARGEPTAFVHGAHKGSQVKRHVGIGVEEGHGMIGR